MKNNINPFFSVPKKIYYFISIILIFLAGLILLMTHVPIGIHISAFHINHHTVSVPIEYQNFFKVNQIVFIDNQLIKIKNMSIKDGSTVYLYVHTPLIFKKYYSIQISKKTLLSMFLEKR